MRYGSGTPTGDAFYSGHLVPSHLGLAYVLIVETNPFPELVVIFPDYALRTSLGTFSILLTLLEMETFTVRTFDNIHVYW